MKYSLIACIALVSFPLLATSYSGTTGANHGRSAPVTTPYAPCYVNGEYIGTIEITYCKAKHGSFTKKEFIKY